MPKHQQLIVIDRARNLGADCLVLDTELSPAQQRNWEAASGLCVIDREEVILDIFSERARTKEAVLQVELARSEHSLPRLKNAWSVAALSVHPRKPSLFATTVVQCPDGCRDRWGCLDGNDRDGHGGPPLRFLVGYQLQAGVGWIGDQVEGRAARPGMGRPLAKVLRGLSCIRRGGIIHAWSRYRKCGNC